ncbi:MAG TPA: hypothetical protein VLB27_02865 [candidate division Zixibacteria bacterium]|nr:hypothetical protein [candidate division Zixibacteria bacterium]
MSALGYLSRYVLQPLYNDLRGFGGILRSVDHWRSLANESPESIRRLTQRRLARLLRRAFTETTYYRDLFIEHGIDKRLENPDVLATIPYLDKQIIRAQPEAFLNQTIRPERLIRSMTGGSTSEPLIFYRDHGTHCMRWGLHIAQNEALGWRHGEWYGMVWGAAQDLPTGDTLRARALNLFLHRRILLNAMSLDESAILAFIRQVRRKRPQFVYGYPVLLEYVATVVLEKGWTFPAPKYVVVTAEKLTESARTTIEKAFGCPALDRYASREFGVVADQVPGTNYLRIAPANVIVEIAPIDTADPSFGELVITDLLNVGMPMIRYRTGDVGRLTRVGPDGRQEWRLSEISGRTTDLLVTREGRIVSGTAVDPFFEEYIGYDQLQVVQETTERFTVRVKPNKDYGPQSEMQIREKLVDVCGEGIEVKIELVDNIQRDPSGKFRIVISHVAPRILGRHFHSSQ